MKQLKHPLIFGTTLLTLVGVICRGIGFLYRIFLSRTIGSEALGKYQLIFPVYGLCLSLLSAGLQTAISKQTATQIGKSKTTQNMLPLLCGLLITCPLSLLVAFCIWTKADAFSILLIHSTDCGDLLRIMSYSLPPAAIHGCVNGYFYGKKQVAVPCITQLTEQLCRCLGVYILCTLVLSQGGVPGAAEATYGLVFSEFGSLIISITVMLWQPFSVIGKLRQGISSLLALAIPLTFTHVIQSLFNSFEVLLIPTRLQAYGYGQKDSLSIFGAFSGMALSIILLPTAFTGSLSVLLLPTISEALAQNQKKRIEELLQKVLILSILGGFALTFLFLWSGDFIGAVLFHNELASFYICRLCWICPFLILNSLLSSIYHGLGNAITPLLITIFTCSLRILAIWFAIPRYGMDVYLLAMLATQILASALYLFFFFRSDYVPLPKRSPKIERKKDSE